MGGTVKMKKVAIIGAGASGLLCAIECAKNGLDVSVFEQNSKVAKKILVSGNGRCNISNTQLSPQDYFSQNPSFVTYALQNFGYKAFEKYVSDMGLVLQKTEDGRVYPLSNEAKSVATLLMQHATLLGVKILTDTKITTLPPLFKDYDAVVVATGSEAASHLGGCADGYTFAQEFGHTVIPTFASLVQLHLKEKIVKKMTGAKIFAEVSLYINGQKEMQTQGDVLFSNYGVSGFAILDISHFVSEALLHFQAVDISINLLPEFTIQKLSNHIQKVAKANPLLNIEDILAGLLPQKILKAVLETLDIQHATPITTKLTKKIANKILHWKFEVTDTHGFRHAEVSGGGVNTQEINPKTFESYKKKNLYFTGEVLDVVGRRGGFNFAFAWASGYLAAQDIIRKKLHNN